MNRSHDAHRVDEARAEELVRSSERAPTDPELAADWRLKQELAALGPEPLSSTLRQAVLEETSQRSRWRGLPLALAAGLAGLLVVATVIERPGVGVEDVSTVAAGPSSALDADELQLALATIDETSRRAFGVAGREVGAHLRFPAVDVDQLPYGRLLTSFRLTPPHAHQPEEN